MIYVEKRLLGSGLVWIGKFGVRHIKLVKQVPDPKRRSKLDHYPFLGLRVFIATIATHMKCGTRRGPIWKKSARSVSMDSTVFSRYQRTCLQSPTSKVTSPLSIPPGNKYSVIPPKNFSQRPIWTMSTAKTATPLSSRHPG